MMNPGDLYFFRYHCSLPNTVVVLEQLPMAGFGTSLKFQKGSIGCVVFPRGIKMEDIFSFFKLFWSDIILSIEYNMII